MTSKIKIIKCFAICISVGYGNVSLDIESHFKEFQDDLILAV